MTDLAMINEPIIIEERITCQKEEVDLTAIMVSTEEGSNHVVAEQQTPKRAEKKVSSKPTFDDMFGFFFYKVAGKDEKLNSFELQQVMSMAFHKEFPTASSFSLEACRSMIGKCLFKLCLTLNDFLNKKF